MKTTKILVLAAMVAGSAMFGTSAQAGEFGYGCRKGGEWNYFDHVGDFCKQHGVKFSHGYFYPGLVQKHFTEKWFDEYYKTDMAFDPHAHMPYYFCAGHGVWYPIHYIETVGPGAKGPGPVLAGGVKGGVVGGAPVVGGSPAVGGPAVGGPAVGGEGTPAVGAGGTPAVAPGGAPVAPKGDAAPKGDGPAAVAPAKAVSAPSGVAVAKNETSVAKKEVAAPAGTFDDAIPADIN